MALRLNRQAYQQLVDEDLKWLAQQQHTLERNHIEQIVRDSVYMYHDVINEIKLTESVLKAVQESPALDSNVKRGYAIPERIAKLEEILDKYYHDRA